jgi:hypothetical protein
VNESVGPAHPNCTPEKVEQIMQQSPKCSARQQAVALQMLSSSLQSFLDEDLRFHLYKTHTTQELREQDKASHVNFCRQFLDLVENDILILPGEVHFHLSSYVYKHNFRYWSDKDPMWIYEKPFHSQKITVWCAVSTFGVIGPFFFEENNQAVTVDSESYSTVL